MDLFPNGGFVRLQNCANRKYVHADEDWLGVSLGPPARAPSPLTAVWRVQHRVTTQGAAFLLLQGAAYGRYLALSPEPAPPGHLGRRAVQGDLDEHNLVEAMLFRWRADRVDLGHNYVRLRQFQRHLRANGRHRFWNTGVTVGTYNGGRVTTMMQWTVQVVAVSPAPPPLPVAAQPPVHEGRLRRLLFWRRAGHGVHPHPPQRIWHVRANSDGDFDQNHDQWPSFVFHDGSIFNLRAEVALHQVDWNGDFSFITLCVWPGLDGQLMPLVTDLPRSGEHMYIVVLTTESPAVAALVYPNVHDAQAP